MRFAILALALTAALVLPAQGETLKSCRAIDAKEKRLACYDGLDAATAVDPHALLLQLLGDPERIGKDYDVLGNSAEVFKLLPGRWVVASWNNALPFLENAETFQKACAKVAVDIAFSSDDYFSATVTREDPKHGTLHLRDITLSARWRLAESTNLETAFKYLGLKAESGKLGPAKTTIARSAVLATYLPLTKDVLLTIDSLSGEMGLMLRCPAS